MALERLWLVRRVGHIDLGEHGAAVIRAATEADARAAAEQGLWPKRAWSSPDRATCVPLDHSGEPGIVLDSFYAG